MCFLWIGIIASVVYGMSANKICRSFLHGVRGIASVCIMVGLARSIAVALDAGHILDTVVYFCAKGLGNMPSILQAPIMLYIHTVINFFITSGSGQATVTMPIMLRSPISWV